MGISDGHAHAVLVVDDDRDTLQAIGVVLESVGLDVKLAGSGFEAIDAVVDGLRPCLVMMDLRMPEIDGFETWRRMRRLPGMSATPVVAFSAEPPNTFQNERAGFVGHLQKPVTVGVILDTVQRHCARQ